MSDRRAMVFIDGQNLYYGAREFFDGDNPIDYVELVEYLSGDAFLVRPYLFTSHRKDDKPHGWYHALRLQGGFRIVSRPLRERDGSYQEKGIDVELATEFIAQGFNDSYDVAVLVTGDEDYSCAVRYVQDQGKVVKAAMFENQIGGLKTEVDRYVQLDDVVNEFTE